MFEFGTKQGTESGNGYASRADYCRIFELAPLMRFAFVMSVLERYSEHECYRLLNCTVPDVIDARSQALQTAFTLSGVAIARDKLSSTCEQSQ